MAVVISLQGLFGAPAIELSFRLQSIIGLGEAAFLILKPWEMMSGGKEGEEDFKHGYNWILLFQMLAVENRMPVCMMKSRPHGHRLGGSLCVGIGAEYCSKLPGTAQHTTRLTASDSLEALAQWSSELEHSFFLDSLKADVKIHA
eukprot:1154317-Pelagomonas_calceolata.AAC.2